MFENFYRINKAEQEREPQADEYRADNGLIYCVSCGMPRQCRLTEERFANSPGIQRLKENSPLEYRRWADTWLGVFPTPCKCSDAKREQAKKNNSQATAESNRRRGLRDRRLIESRFEKADGTNSKSFEVLKRYADKFEDTKRYSLLIQGASGSGKTFAVGCLANRLTDSERYVYCTTVFQIVEYFKNRQQAELLREVRQCDLLIVDGLENILNLSPSDCANVMNVIDEREATGRPQAITTQVIPTKAPLTSQRIFDKVKAFVKIGLAPRQQNKQLDLMSMLLTAETI